MQDREVINIRINGANNGGLLSAFDGLPAFAPFSLVTKDVDKPFVTLEVRSLVHSACISSVGSSAEFTCMHLSQCVQEWAESPALYHSLFTQKFGKRFVTAEVCNSVHKACISSVLVFC